MTPDLQQTIRRTRRAILTVGLLVCMVVIGGFASPLQARSRDSDASRMQARKIDFPAEHTDKLSPPDDRIDWTYFKLAEARTVTVQVDFDNPAASGKLSLTAATGVEIASSALDAGKARLSRKLDPGVYYVSVQASAASAYTLSVR